MELLENEIAKPIPGYEDYYITSKGRVWSGKSQKWLHQSLRGDKTINSMYLSITLCKDGEKKSFTVHRLVAEAFLSNPNNLPQVNHKDENKLNNDVGNLEWCDNKYNVTYGDRIPKAVATRIANNNTKKVIMCDKNTKEPIKTFNSGAEAGRFVTQSDKKGSGTHILQVCRGERQSAYGYYWKFLEENT